MGNAGVLREGDSLCGEKLKVGIGGGCSVSSVFEDEDNDAVEPLAGHQSGMHYAGEAYQNRANQYKQAER